MDSHKRDLELIALGAALASSPVRQMLDPQDFGAPASAALVLLAAKEMGPICRTLKLPECETPTDVLRALVDKIGRLRREEVAAREAQRLLLIRRGTPEWVNQAAIAAAALEAVK